MKLKFFLSKFIMFLSLTLIPVCILGLISGSYIHNQVREEALEKADTITDRMRQSMEELTSTLDILKITTSSDARFHLALLSALRSDSTKNIDMSDLNQAMQSLYYSLTTRPDILSIYLTIEGSPYFINGLNRETFANAVDKTWVKDAGRHQESDFFQLRYVKRNKFDTQLQPVVTVYQQMKYKELMAINLQPEYFNNWLDSISDYENQVLLITDTEGQVFFHNHNIGLLPSSLFQKEGYLRSPADISQAAEGDYFLNTGSFTGNYGLQYMSLIPRREVFRLSDTILMLTLAGVLISIFVSSSLAYIYTLRDYRQIFSIIDLFDKAERGEFSPQQDYQQKNEAYFHIIRNIISLFMSQSYLKVQLDAKKYALLTAQLSALQYQLNPHFLFNTLQSIDLEILKAAKRPTNANLMISELSELLRYSLNDPLVPVTVEEEISATKCYLELQNLRSGEPFKVIWEYGSDVLNCPVPRLLLQPIIENSITHSSLPERKMLKIKIRFFLRESGLSVVVIDNGRGMSSEQLNTLRINIADDQVEGSGHHIGLKNISQRIRLAYENGSVKVWSKNGLGTIIRIDGIQ